MNAREKGFLLLCSTLGDPERKVLTQAQLRQLASRVRAMERPQEERELGMHDLATLGYGEEMARRILALLSETELLEHYLARARRAQCACITRAGEEYPLSLRRKLGADAPACLWLKGDASLLHTRMIALVGSRDLCEENARFATELGAQVAKQGYTLVSGNARGADSTAQEACLAAGGQVVSIVSDPLMVHRTRENVLYVSENGFDEPFSAQRALSRNRCIHALGEKAFVAQVTARRGGTWDGSVKNLRYRLSPLFVFDDGSEGMELLAQMGATKVSLSETADFDALCRADLSLFDE